MALPTDIPEAKQYAPYDGYQVKVSSSSDKLHANLEYMANILTWMGWSFNAICAALGCWRVECWLNPNFPQYYQFPGYRIGKRDDGSTYKNWGGFGMPHWTQWYPKFGVWAEETYGLSATASDSNPLRNFYVQMLYHEYECKNGIYRDFNYGISTPRWYRAGAKTWVDWHGYTYAWDDWKTSKKSITELTNAYYWQYERSSGGQTSADARANYANNYATYLHNNWTYEPPTGGGPTPPGPTPGGQKITNFIIIAKASGLF